MVMVMVVVVIVVVVVVMVVVVMVVVVVVVGVESCILASRIAGVRGAGRGCMQATAAVLQHSHPPSPCRLSAR